MSRLIASPVASPASDSGSASTPTSASTPASASSSSGSTGTSLLSLTHLSSSPPPGAALAPPLKAYGTPAPLRERMRLVHALRITIPPVPEFQNGGFVGPQPWKVADEARRAKGAVQPTRANLPRRVKKTPSAALAPVAPIVPLAVVEEPVAAPSAVGEAKVDEGGGGESRPVEVPPRTARSVAQPARSNLPRRRAALSSKVGKKKKTFFDSSDEEEAGEEEEPSAVPRSALSALPATSGRTGTSASCLQRLAPQLSVAFFDEDEENGGADEAGAVPEELGAFKHVVSVRCAPVQKKRRGRPADTPVEMPPIWSSLSQPPTSTDEPFSNARRLCLTLPAATSSPSPSPPPDAHLSAEQMRAALEFVRATPQGEDVLVTAPGLRPGDAAVLVALCVAAERRERDGAAWSVREVLREVDDEEDERVVGFWKGVVQEEVAFVAEGVLGGGKPARRRGFH